MLNVGGGHILGSSIFICALYDLGILSIGNGIISVFLKISMGYRSCDILIRCFLFLMLAAVVTSFLG